MNTAAYARGFQEACHLPLIGSTVDGRHFCNISCFPFALKIWELYDQPDGDD